MTSNAGQAAVTASPNSPPRAVLIGAGSLGRAFLRRLRDRGSPINLVGLMTAHHGRLVSREGIDPARALQLIESEGLGESAPAELRKLLDVAQATIVIECIPQNIRSGEPSLSFLRQALDAGVNVVTSNKAPIVLGYRDLRHRAAKSKTQFRFESTVLDGLPIFGAMSYMPDVSATKVRGVLNATSSLVLESVALGASRGRGLARAQAQGIAEADSVLDLDGWDAAAKVALLANVWMGGALRVVDVNRAGCDAVKDEEIREAARRGARYRLVGELEKHPEGAIQASVRPCLIEVDDPLHGLVGGAGGITVTTDANQTFTWLQSTYGVDDAAFGLIQDCRAIGSGLPQI